MTQKEKAKELVNQFNLKLSANNIINLSIAKKISIKAVDLAIEYNDFHIEYLEEVKQEIKNYEATT